MLNPYSGSSFFSFFGVATSRLLLLLKGEKSSLVSDEVQLLALLLIALSSSLLGSFLLLKRVTMMANSLSHTTLLGIVGAFLIERALFGEREGIYQPTTLGMMIGALIAAFATAFVTEFFTKKLRLQEDASIGLIFTSFFAIGVLLVTALSKNTHLGVEAIMGNVDALHRDALGSLFLLFLFNSALLFLLFKPLSATLFDPQFARTLRIPLSLLSYLLLFQTALLAMGSFRAVGALLFLAFLVAPPLTARLFTKRVVPFILLSMGVGSTAALLSVPLARHCLSLYQMPLSTSGLAATLLGLLFGVGALFYARRAQ